MACKQFHDTWRESSCKPGSRDSCLRALDGRWGYFPEKDSLSFLVSRPALLCSGAVLSALSTESLSLNCWPKWLMNEGHDKFPLALHCASGLTHLLVQSHPKSLYIQCVHDVICYFKYYSLGVFYYSDEGINIRAYPHKALCPYAQPLNPEIPPMPWRLCSFPKPGEQLYMPVLRSDCLWLSFLNVKFFCLLASCFGLRAPCLFLGADPF